ncbi:MAG: hypothetical protein M9952_06830 [Microthrixaceae bacterium]|nr:hypothetical protein [Microthrixaceae bacterium]MCO5312638.1 hypothetical protein [Microthrixaceae bacterium]HPB46324.1 hypothetical protein [Microthrixaceae bacterium]
MTDTGLSISMIRSLDWATIWRAAVSTATFAVPLTLLQWWLIETDRASKGDSLMLLLNLAIMGSGALGGFAAAKLAPRLALQHGAVAPALAAIAIQIVGAIRRSIVGEEVSNVLGWIMLALLMAVFGMFGAWVNEKVSPPRTEG